MTLVDGVVANRLALQVCRNGEHLQAVAVQDLPPGGDVVVINGAGDDIEMIPGAGDLEPVVAPFRRQLRNLLERQVGPLAGEQRDRSAHRRH